MYFSPIDSNQKKSENDSLLFSLLIRQNKNMKNKILLVHPNNHELARLKNDGILNEKGHPVTVTHYVTREMSDGGHVIQIYDNVLLSTLKTSDDKVIIFDRHGHAFEVKCDYLEEIVIDMSACAI